MPCCLAIGSMCPLQRLWAQELSECTFTPMAPTWKARATKLWTCQTMPFFFCATSRIIFFSDTSLWDSLICHRPSALHDRASQALLKRCQVKTGVVSWFALPKNCSVGILVKTLKDVGTLAGSFIFDSRPVVHEGDQQVRGCFLWLFHQLKSANHKSLGRLWPMSWLPLRQGGVRNPTSKEQDHDSTLWRGKTAAASKLFPTIMMCSKVTHIDALRQLEKKVRMFLISLLLDGSTGWRPSRICCKEKEMKEATQQVFNDFLERSLEARPLSALKAADTLQETDVEYRMIPNDRCKISCSWCPRRGGRNWSFLKRHLKAELPNCQVYGLWSDKYQKDKIAGSQEEVVNTLPCEPRAMWSAKPEFFTFEAAHEQPSIHKP